MEENYIYQEANAIIEKLKDFFALEGLKKHFNVEDYIAKDANDILNSHSYLHEWEEFLSHGYEVSIPSLIDLDPIFDVLEKGSVLSCVELYSIGDLLTASEYIYDILYDKKEYFFLNNDALDLNPLTQLKKDLQNSIESDMTISDHASPTLRDVRSQIRALERQLANIMNTYKSKYSAYLSSDTITFKAGEEALPVKLSDKGYVRGSVVSYSSSGETVYMVPYEVLDLRNKLHSLKQEEATEVMKVLTDLSSKCRKQLKFLTKDYEIISRFDRYLGAVRFGMSYMGCIAQDSKDELLLTSLFHPLLKAKVVVTNSLQLGKEEPKALLITGPNAGGKSVFIKAVALAVLMDKLGLYVPCKGEAKIPYLDEVYFLGGDNQSVLDNLSTFSSHLLGIKNITEKADENSLVIIDEVGEGTSPKDGEALGVGLLKFFVKKGCFTILTSHFDGLKIYAASDEKVLTGAMEFNVDNMKPTFRLLLHTTGKSYGILLARQMGLEESIVKDAIAFEQERSTRDTDALMEKLTEQVSENEKKARQLDNARKDLEKIIQKRQKAIDSLNEEKNSIRMKAEEKVKRLVEERVAQINSIWEEKQGKGDITYSQVSQAKGELNKIKEVNEPSLENKGKEEELKDVKIGDLLVDEDNRRCKVIEVRKNEVLLDVDGLTFQRKIKGLKRAKLTQNDVKVKKEKKYTATDSALLHLGESQGIELNIIGLHVDEAMRKVTSFLDSARIHRYTYVRIIHGAGTFALKNAVWKYLANHKEFIKEYRLGGQGEGGLGATVVTLK